MHKSSSSIYRTTLMFAAIVVIVAGMKAAASIMVPFMLSVFIALLLSPFLHWLIRLGIPKVVSFFLIILFMLILFISLTGFITTHIADLFAKSDIWQKAMMENLQKFHQQLHNFGIMVDKEAFFAFVQPQKMFAFTLSIVKNTSMLLSNSFLIFFTVLFMLMESFSIKEKILYIQKSGASGFNERIEAFADRLNHYFTLKALTSAITGIWITAILFWYDIPYPMLWGLGGFILNFIPVIGSIIAAVPPVLIALATQGYADALWIAGWFLIINTVIGNILEPKLMGRGLELSELVVFLSLVFWGWVFGKVGMLLAVPLTMIVKFALETSDSAKWVGVLLSDSVKKR